MAIIISNVLDEPEPFGFKMENRCLIATVSGGAAEQHGRLSLAD